jgi:hypothetical protein
MLPTWLNSTTFTMDTSMLCTYDACEEALMRTNIVIDEKLLAKA